MPTQLRWTHIAKGLQQREFTSNPQHFSLFWFLSPFPIIQLYNY